MAVLIVRRVPRRGSAVSAALTTVESLTALVIAHTAAGGALPGAAWLLAMAALGYVASSLVLSRRTSIRVALPAMILTQLLMHSWLVTLSGPEHAAHAGTMLGLSGPMVTAHLVAATVTALAWTMRRRAVDVLVRWADTAPLPVPALRASAAPAPSYVARRDRALSVAPSRGPPQARATAC